MHCRGLACLCLPPQQFLAFFCWGLVAAGLVFEHGGLGRGGSGRGDGGGVCGGLLPREGGGGSGRVGWLGGTSRWGDLGPRPSVGPSRAPLTSSCPPSIHTIILNLTLTFAASRFSHASHVDWAEQDPPNFVHGSFCHIIALHFGPQQ